MTKNDLHELTDYERKQVFDLAIGNLIDTLNAKDQEEAIAKEASRLGRLNAIRDFYYNQSYNDTMQSLSNLTP